MQKTENKSLLNILDDVIDLQRLISKTYAASMALYECLDSGSDFAARVGDKVLADTAEVICDYSREADSVIAEIHNDLNKLHDYHNCEI